MRFSFKKNPATVLREANNRPVAALNRNEAVFYIVEPQLFQTMIEELTDHALYQTVLARAAEKAHATEVDINQI